MTGPWFLRSISSPCSSSPCDNGPPAHQGCLLCGNGFHQNGSRHGRSSVRSKERWCNRIIEKLAGVYCWVCAMAFRMHVHTGVEATIRAEGVKPFYQVDTILWRVELHERQNATE